MTDEKVSARSVWIAGLFGVIGTVAGALVAGVATAYVSDRSLETQIATQDVAAARERDMKIRDQRRPVYIEFRDAANEWATRQATASKCPNLQLCLYGQSDLDHSRYRLQRAVNAMHIYGSRTR